MMVKVYKPSSCHTHNVFKTVLKLFLVVPHFGQVEIYKPNKNYILNLLN